MTPPGFFSQNTNDSSNNNRNTKVQLTFECHPGPSAVLTSFQDVTCTDTSNSPVLASLCSYGNQRPERLSYLSKVTFRTWYGWAKTHDIFPGCLGFRL